mmetsp:Transcript_38704/g.116262  ORF Transcript_38704/g.116262 Transcript_38704/m.116262 type:complete len:539 (-) Transcript_38704:456-2072(-)
MYSLRVGLILGGMIITGSLRSVAIKVLFQLGFRDPLFVTLLYLLGQALALAVHFFFVTFRRRQLCRRRSAAEVMAKYSVLDPRPDVDDDDGEHHEVEMMENGFLSRKDDGDDATTTIEDMSVQSSSKLRNVGRDVDFPVRKESQDIILDNGAECSKPKASLIIEPSSESVEISPQGSLRNAAIGEGVSSFACAVPQQEPREALRKDSNGRHLNAPCIRTHRRRGSRTGLEEEASKAAAWAHSVPWYLKPTIPGLFNLCNAALRWASLVIVPASTAEMLISGLELVLSVVAARVLRKRLVSAARWGGISVVAVGIILVGWADVKVEEEEDGGHADGADDDEPFNNSGNLFVGNILILGQCILSVVQDLAEEVFLQETDMPATLLLGMEGMYGLLFGIPLYLFMAPKTGEASLAEIWAALVSDPIKGGYIMGLVLLVLLTGIFNIVATEVTSSMTRNVWKNFRTVLVWALGLVLFYAGGNENLGEEWVVPGSFYVLGGFLVMTLGTTMYYSNRCESAAAIAGLWQQFYNWSAGILLAGAC